MDNVTRVHQFHYNTHVCTQAHTHDATICRPRSLNLYRYYTFRSSTPPTLYTKYCTRWKMHTRLWKMYICDCQVFYARAQYNRTFVNRENNTLYTQLLFYIPFLICTEKNYPDNYTHHKF